MQATQEKDINCESIQVHKQDQSCHLFSGSAKWNELVEADEEYGYFQRFCRQGTVAKFMGVPQDIGLYQRLQTWGRVKLILL